MPSTTVGTGNLGVYMDATRDVLRRSIAWQNWAGIEHVSRVHYTENREELENGASFVRGIEKTPFANIWIPTISVEVIQCRWRVVAFVLFQADVKTQTSQARANHDESAILFMNEIGQIMEDISLIFLQPLATDGFPLCTEITMVSEPFRVPAIESGDENDFWTTTLGFNYG